MTKSETMKQLAAASNAARLKELGQGIDALHSAKVESAQELASMLEPLAQAMAALTDETRETLATIEQRSRRQGEAMKAEIEAAARVLAQASNSASQAARTMVDASGRTQTRHYVLVALTALTTAMLVSAFWLWLAPPTVQNHLDAKAVAEYLWPEIARVKPSNGR